MKFSVPKSRANEVNLFLYLNPTMLIPLKIILYFVITLTGIDKAQNNLSFICRYYYLKNLEEELSSTKTYIPSDKSEDEIVLKSMLCSVKSTISLFLISLFLLCI